jgi:hypothetical protein
MNDHDSLGAVRGSLVAARDSLSQVHMDMSLAAVIRRGQVKRWRHRVAGAAAAAVLAAGAVFAVTALAPASHPAEVRLTAWTVTRQPDGDVRVSIRQLHDPARLQGRLRSDGIPASVTYFGHANPACRPYEHVAPPRWLAGRQHVPVTVIARVIARTTHGVVRLAPGYPPAQATNHFVIVPAALPPGVGVQISAEVTPARVALSFGLAHASANCTGR